jgi:voltage-gated potassium channel
VSLERDEAARLRDDPGRREDLRGRLDRYLDVPLALASVLMLLLAVIVDVLVLLVPFLRFLKVLGVLRAARALPLFRLAVFGGRGSGGALTLLRRRRLGQLALVSVMVILIGAAAGLLLETGAPGATIEDFGDALWWSGALVTTVGSEIYPVTTGGRVLGFVLMLYAVGIFSYFIASIASVLVGVDSQKPSDGSGRKGGTFRLDAQERATLRRILDRAGEG